MERYSIGKEDVQSVAGPRNQMSWVYWEHLLAEFGIALDRFAGRASASLGNGALIVIRLAAGDWHVQHASPEGWKIAVRDYGLESLRAYLSKHGPRLLPRWLWRIEKSVNGGLTHMTQDRYLNRGRIVGISAHS